MDHYHALILLGSATTGVQTVPEHRNGRQILETWQLLDVKQLQAISGTIEHGSSPCLPLSAVLTFYLADLIAVPYKPLVDVLPGTPGHEMGGLELSFSGSDAA